MKQTKQISQKKAEILAFKEKRAFPPHRQNIFFKMTPQIRQVQFHGSKHRG